MFRPPDNRTRTLRTDGEHDWAAELAAAGSCEGWTVLKDHARGTVWRGTLGDEDCVIKCLPLDRLKRRAQVLLRSTPLDKQWDGARILENLGIPTASPRALVVGRREGRSVGALVMSTADGETVLRVLAERRLSPRSEHALARELARVTEALWQRGYRNRDHKPSNLLVSGGESGEPRVSIIDTGSIRRVRGYQSWDDRVDMLVKLVVEPLGVGHPPRRALMMRALHELLHLSDAGGVEAIPREDIRRDRREIWEEVVELIEAHGDPTPKDDPLA